QCGSRPKRDTLRRPLQPTTTDRAQDAPARHVADATNASAGKDLSLVWQVRSATVGCDPHHVTSQRDVLSNPKETIMSKHSRTRQPKQLFRMFVDFYVRSGVRRGSPFRGIIVHRQHVCLVRAVNKLDAKQQAKAICKAAHPKAYRVGYAGLCHR